MKGYAKWTVLNQVVKEIHPTGESLSELMTNNSELQDEIIEGLKKDYSEQFLKLSDSENQKL